MAGVIGWAVAITAGGAEGTPAAKLADLSLEDLSNVEVTSVSKKAGQNLLQNHHRELGASFGVGVSEIPRSVLEKVTWRF